jgi:hypoxanthine-guanine phosphoribosyltransferase
MKYLKLFEKFYSPPREVKDKLHLIIKNLTKKYKGGKEFFHALDDSIKDITNQDMILALLKGNSDEWIATSGAFGDIVYKMWEDGKFKCKGLVVFNGKMLTHKKGVNNWYPVDFDLSDKEFIYVDDSFFSGSTYKKINGFLKENNSIIKEVSVIYDGSRMKTNIVKSFFRYYK